MEASGSKDKLKEVYKAIDDIYDEHFNIKGEQPEPQEDLQPHQYLETKIQEVEGKIK